MYCIKNGRQYNPLCQFANLFFFFKSGTDIRMQVNCHLTHCGLSSLYGVWDIGHHWFMYCLVACAALRHYLNKWRLVIKRNEVQWNWNLNTIIFIQQNVFQNVAWKLAAILFRSQCVNSSPPCAAYMRQWVGSALVQIMACHLFGAKPLSKPMPWYCQFDP